MLAAGGLPNAAATMPKRRLRLESLKSASANSSVKSSGMEASAHAPPIQTTVSNMYRFVFSNFRTAPRMPFQTPLFVYKDQGARHRLISHAPAGAGHRSPTRPSDLAPDEGSRYGFSPSRRGLPQALPARPGMRSNPVREFADHRIHDAFLMQRVRHHRQGVGHACDHCFGAFDE